MLAAQGISDDQILTMLGYDPAESDISIHTLDPVELLESGEDAQTGGTLLLKAQQIFAITNAVAALAEEAGMTQAAAVSATLSAFGELDQADLDKLVGDMSTGDAGAVIGTIITDVMTVAGATEFSDDVDILGAMTTSIVNANHLLGEVDPLNALGEEARAAALITQNDLVTEFRAVGQMDASDAEAAADIANKLNATFADLDDLRENFQAFYKDQIASQAESGGGIITRVDISVLVGNIDQDTGVDNAAYISASDIIGNDRNTGEGDLRLVSIEPTNINWKTIDGAKVARQIESAGDGHPQLRGHFQPQRCGLLAGRYQRRIR